MLASLEGQDESCLQRQSEDASPLCRHCRSYAAASETGRPRSQEHIDGLSPATGITQSGIFMGMLIKGKGTHLFGLRD